MVKIKTVLLAAKESIIKVGSKAHYILKNPNPTVLVVIAGLCVVVGVVLAVVAGMRVADELDAMANELEQINQEEDAYRAINLDWTEDDDKMLEFKSRRKEVRRFHWLRIFLDILPPLMFTCAGLGSMGWGVHTLNVKNEATAAVLATTLDEFQQYRDRVVDKEGADADAAYRFGEPDKVITTETNENGETVEKEELIFPIQNGVLTSSIKFNNNKFWNVETIGKSLDSGRQNWIHMFKMSYLSALSMIDNPRDPYLTEDDLFILAGFKPVQEISELGIDIQKFRDEGRTFSFGKILDDIVWYQDHPTEINPYWYNKFISGELNEIPIEFPCTGKITHLKPKMCIA